MKKKKRKTLPAEPENIIDPCLLLFLNSCITRVSVHDAHPKHITHYVMSCIYDDGTWQTEKETPITITIRTNRKGSEHNTRTGVSNEESATLNAGKT